MAEEKSGSFEESLRQLERLVAEMESGALPLDDMIKHFGTGKKLAERCTAKLNEIRAQIEKVTNAATGETAPLELETPATQGN